MYDHIRCDYRLPNGKVGVEDQTKEFRNFFYDHVIDAEGQLWIDDGRNEEVPKDERPYPDAPDGSFEAFIGSSRHIQKLVKADDYYGAIEIDDYILLFRPESSCRSMYRRMPGSGKSNSIYRPSLKADLFRRQS